MAKIASADTTTVPENQPADPAQAPDSPGGQAQVVTEDANEDPDDVALRELLAAEKAKPEPEPKPASAQAETPAPTAGQEPAKPDQAQPGQQQQDHQQPMIPKSRLDEEIQRRRKAESDANYLRGLAEGLVLRSPQKPGGNPEPQPVKKDPAARLAEIKAEKVKLAKQYDDGEIGLADLTEKHGALDEEAWVIRSDSLKPSQEPAPRPQQTIGSDDSLVLEERTVKLEQDHPYTLHIPADTPEGLARWAFLENEAAAQLEAEGMALHPGRNGELPPREQLALRTRMAELTDKYGPLWVGNLPQQQQQQDPAAGQPGGLSRTAEARSRKLDLAEQHPIDVSNLGNPANATDTQAIADKLPTMSEAELEALPKEVFDRILSKPS